MKKIIIASILGFAVLVIACKKSGSNDNSNPPVNQKKPKDYFIGKWYYKADTAYEHEYGRKTDTSYTAFGPNDYVLIDSNGKTYFNIPSQNDVDTTTYRFLTDSTLIWYGDTSRILIATDTRLRIYSTEYYSSPYPGYYEDYLELKK